MLKFLARRLGVMALTMVCLSLVVFFFVNLEPNLTKLATFQTEMRASDQEKESWLARNGYRDNFFVRYGRWIGVLQKQPVTDPATGEIVGTLPLLRRSRRCPSIPAFCRATSAAPPPSRPRCRTACRKPFRQPAS